MSGVTVSGHVRFSVLFGLFSVALLTSLVMVPAALADIVLTEDDWDSYLELGAAPGATPPEIAFTVDGRNSLWMTRPSGDKWAIYLINVTQFPDDGRRRFPVRIVSRQVQDDTNGLTIRNLTIDPDLPVFMEAVQSQTSFLSILMNGSNITAAGQTSRARDDRNIGADADLPGSIGASGPQVPDPTSDTALFPTGTITTRNATLELRLGPNLLRIDATDTRDLPRYDPDCGWQAFTLTIGPNEPDLLGEVFSSTCFPAVTRSISPNPYTPGDTVTVSLAATGITASTKITETFPSGWTVTDAGGGTVSGNTIAFTIAANGASTYRLTAPRDIGVRFSGTVEVSSAQCQNLPIKGTVKGTGEIDRASPPADGPVSGGLGHPLGFPLIPGGQEEVSASPLVVNVFASGADIWNMADEGRFVEFGQFDTFDIRCAVPRFDGNHAWGKAGLMARTSVDASSPYAFIHITGSNGTDFQYRDLQAAAAGNNGNANVTGPANILRELRLMRRRGTLIEAFARRPGEARWRFFATRDMPSLATLVGVAVTSHDNAELAGARFENIEISETPPPALGAVTNLSCAVEGGNIRLNFTPPAGATAIVVSRDGQDIADLPGNAVTYTDAAVSNPSAAYAVIAYDATNLPGTPARCSPTGLRPTGAPIEMLILGPIDLINPANPGLNVGPQCNDNGKLGITDYLTDGLIGESGILVKEGDRIAPDFFGSAGGFGVKQGANTAINPDALGGILEVWKATTQADGRINFNDADKIGDPGGQTVNDYIVYSLVYLENTTNRCLDAILEVGSDDAVKVIFNGQRVHLNNICRGLQAYGAGDRVPVSLAVGPNIVLIGVVERGGGTDVRLVVRNPDFTPLTDGRVVARLSPPARYPSLPGATVTRALSRRTFKGGDPVEISLTAANVTGAVTIIETFPAGWTVADNGGGTVSGNTITFTRSADGVTRYRLTAPAAAAPSASFSGFITQAGAGGCSAVGGDSGLILFDCDADPAAEPARLVKAFAFGSRNLVCPTLNDPATSYTMVHQVGGQPLSIAYDPVKGYGYEVLYSTTDPAFPLPKHTPRGGGWEIYGPMDDSPNNRNKFPNTCPEELYDSFIGAKDWFAGAQSCSQALFNPPDPNRPCAEIPGLLPDGIIFRIDVPNGRYRFVGAFGDADNTHAHRILAEDGGEGPPEEIGPDHVVLVHNFDQAQHALNNVDARLGEGVYARVGFRAADGCKIPPLGDGNAPDPKFLDMDEDGLPANGPPNSPVLEVTQGYIRIHQLQANSNDGPGGTRDPNGGDAVILEIWRVGDAAEPPRPPAGLTAIAGDGKVDLSWTAPAGGPAVSGYNVYQTSPGARKKVNTAPVAATSFSVSGLANGTEHCFVVRSAAGNAESADSSTACATPRSAGVLFKRGDVDANGAVEITDPINLLGFLFLGEAQPPCFDSSDADDNGSLEITDAIVSLGFQFLGEAPPPAPGPFACGPDPTAEPPGADFGCAYPAASCQ